MLNYCICSSRKDISTQHACPINRPVCACKRFQAGMDAAPDLILCVPYLETSATKGSMYFLNSSLRVEPLLAWKYSLDLNVTIRRTRGHDGLDCSKTLKNKTKTKTKQNKKANFSVMVTGHENFPDLAR